MIGLLTRVGALIDTRGGKARMAHFRAGWAAAATPQVKFHRTEKVQYRYLEAGSGRTIVFTCDPPMTIEVYGPLVAAFSLHFRVIVVELPAMGFSATTSDYAFGFRETNDDLATFLRAVAGERSILAFSCVASLAALDIAGRTPELASHLALIQAGGSQAFAIWKAGRDPKGILARPIAGQLVMARMALKRIPQWYGLSVGRKEQIPQFCDCAERSFANGAMWSLASAYQIYMRQRAELPRPAQPILSIWGASDGSHPASNKHSLARLYEGVRTVTFDDLGHTPELEAPDLVLAAILDFAVIS
ncbi:alpha/beta hydrolase [Novosphingobium sp.]|uniref:alpha/beta fold hydrolase n=1 Tax=Novosphingobium sp. TaxID=1874826 RepID=UPI002617A287|nr:alpha/beta hydrolase [Novosphingobium sp.]